jgi:transposase
MAERRQSCDAEFREGAVRIVTKTGKTIAQVAEDLGVKETTPGSCEARCPCRKLIRPGRSQCAESGAWQLWLMAPGLSPG